MHPVLDQCHENCSHCKNLWTSRQPRSAFNSMGAHTRLTYSLCENNTRNWLRNLKWLPSSKLKCKYRQHKQRSAYKKKNHSILLLLFWMIKASEKRIKMMQKQIKLKTIISSISNKSRRALGAQIRALEESLSFRG